MRMNMTEFYLLCQMLGSLDECPTYDACLVHQMARNLWWVSIIWCKSIICMMGIHHILRVPKASRHLQHKHQARRYFWYPYDKLNTGIVRANQHCSNNSETQRNRTDLGGAPELAWWVRWVLWVCCIKWFLWVWWAERSACLVFLAILLHPKEFLNGSIWSKINSQTNWMMGYSHFKWKDGPRN